MARQETYIGYGEERVQRFIGQKVWLATGSWPLYIAAISDDGAYVTVEWLTDEFEEGVEVVPAIHLRPYDTQTGGL
jgi:hypothetical protein